jgi:hypothetical protein
MFQIDRLTLTAILIAFELTTAAVGAEKLSKVEIGKRGKAATAYVEVPSGASGTGFCIHPSGLFVTNEHVIQGAELADIIVVLEPSLASQRVLKASVVRVDKQLDLALLRIKEGHEFTSLSLGSAEGIAELAEVVACGFPLGRQLSTDRKEYPAISVNSGAITALRLKDGELQFLQTDVALNFGNSGGPVLDSDGKVIGVVVSKAVGATGINLAIPVSRLERFLKAPDLALISPNLTTETLDKPHEFKVRATSFVPGSPEPDLKLVLQAGDQDAREFAMEKQGPTWTATVVPVSRPATTCMEVIARLGTGTISGTCDDVVIKVADRVVRVSGVRKIDLKPSTKSDSTTSSKPLVLLADGRTTVEGNITGLEKVEIDLGGQKIKLDLAKVTHLTFQPAPPLASIAVSVVATVGDTAVARVEVKLPIRDGASTIPADPSTVSITPPELSDDKVIKRLPDGFSDVALGGGGRYLIFHLPKLKKLAVFDFSEARITKYIPLKEDNIAFAAGLNSLIIGLRDSGKLERWSLTTFELERSAPPPFKENIGAVILGHGSNGPLVVNGYFLDLATYRPLLVRDQKGSERAFSDGYRTPSADGTVYGAWKTNQSPDESTTFVLEGNVLKRYDEGGLKHVIPGPDGSTIYTGKGICAPTLKRSDPDDASYGYCLPAVRGDYFLSLTSASSGKASFTIYLRGLSQSIAKLDKVNHGLNFDGWDREAFGPWKRVFLVPDAHVIAVLPQTNDQVVLYKFNAEAALESSGQDYLIITSQPPRSIRPGSTLNYPIKVKSKRPVTYSLDAGPKGMKVSTDGVLTWSPDDTVNGEQDVILTIKSDGGQEVFHTFAVQVSK